MRNVRFTPPTTQANNCRRGSIMILTSLMLIVMFVFLAFSVDLGFLSLTRSQMQTAADSAALAAAVDLPRAWGPGATMTVSEVDAAARTIAKQVSSQNRMAGQTGTYIDQTRDVRFGFRSWDPNAGSFTESWGTAPFNMVEVTVHRDVAGGGADSPVDLFFGPVFGLDNVSMETKSAVALYPGIGLRIDSSNPTICELLPFTYDLPSWLDVIARNGQDDYHYDEDTGVCTKGMSDGIIEFDLYPETTGNGNGNAGGNQPPGNRGTVDLGSPNNNTDDIKRQILYGLNQFDFSFFPNGELTLKNGPIILNGDTGISAGFEAELNAIIGQPRCIPIFTSVAGNGNNAQFTITKFVGIRILDVKLKGGNKYVMVQPCVFIDETVIRSTSTVVETDSILTPGVIIR